MSNLKKNNTLYKVVINEEGQYSILLVGKENAIGWRDEGKIGLESECLEYIEKNWLDMRPLSLQRHMAKVEKEKLKKKMKKTPMSA